MLDPNIPYATVDDLKRRWQDLPEEDETTATTLLADASAILRAYLSPGHTLDADLLTMITCQMVKRAMDTGGIPDGLSSISQTVGPFAQNFSVANPNADLYLTKAEKRLLGIGKQTAGSYDMLSDW